MGVASVTMVFDRYDKTLSIKHMEPMRRSMSHTATHVIKGTSKVPNYRKFLQNGANKAALAVYICLYIDEQAPAKLHEDESIVLAGGYEDGEKVMVVGKQVLANENLFCSHEEADTRMILHAIELSPNYSRIVVRSDDTDVLVLLLYYCSVGQLHENVYMQSGHSGRYCNRQRFVPVSEIAQHLGRPICSSLVLYQLPMPLLVAI